MGEKPKNHLDSLREKAYALLSLPDCAVDEVISGMGLRDDREVREYKARHEAGHALVHLLRGTSMQKAEISRLRGTTCDRLNTLLGNVVRFEKGRVVTDEAEYQELAKQHPDRNVILSLAGLASTQDPKHGHFFERLINEGLAKGVDESWEDISIPYVYIQDRFAAIHQRTPTQQEISAIFHDLLNEIRSIFSEDKFVGVLTQIKELIKGHRLKKAVNDTILQTLFANGFSQKDLTEMQQRVLSIDIDRVVQKYGRAAA
ncbi:MAG: hypothetical protein WC604_05105 [Candidatus Gracilibacteria bacterium]